MIDKLRNALRGVIWPSLVAAIAGSLAVIVAATADDSDMVIALGLYGVVFALLSPNE